MKNVLLKFAGLFVERVPVDEQGNTLPPKPPGPTGAAQTPMQPVAQPQHGMPAQPMTGYPMQAPAPAPAPQHPMQGVPGQQSSAAGTLSVALRAWVPQEYAAHLAPHGVHVIAAGGSVTSEQAQGWGADVLIVSAECLGQETHLLQQPQLPTVLITPQPVMIPDVPGVTQVQEPLRASDVAAAAREAIAAWARARG